MEYVLCDPEENWICPDADTPQHCFGVDELPSDFLPSDFKTNETILGVCDCWHSLSRESGCTELTTLSYVELSTLAVLVVAHIISFYTGVSLISKIRELKGVAYYSTSFITLVLCASADVLGIITPIGWIYTILAHDPLTYINFADAFYAGVLCAIFVGLIIQICDFLIRIQFTTVFEKKFFSFLRKFLIAMTIALPLTAIDFSLFTLAWMIVPIILLFSIVVSSYKAIQQINTINTSFSSSSKKPSSSAGGSTGTSVKSSIHTFAVDLKNFIKRLIPSVLTLFISIFLLLQFAYEWEDVPHTVWMMSLMISRLMLLLVKTQIRSFTEIKFRKRILRSKGLLDTTSDMPMVTTKPPSSGAESLRSGAVSVRIEDGEVTSGVAATGTSKAEAVDQTPEQDV